MKPLIIFSLLIALFGCENGEVVLSTEKRAAVKQKHKAAGAERRALFVECMELAAKMPRQSDDDVADIVEECSSSSYYVTNYLRR